MTLKRSKPKKLQFGLPGKRKNPMPDKKRGANAKGRAKQQLRKGSLSRSAYDKIVAKANRILAKRKKGKKTTRERANEPARSRERDFWAETFGCPSRRSGRAAGRSLAGTPVGEQAVPLLAQRQAGR